MIATAMIAPSKNPAPIASPRQADAQSPAAVVRPLTWLSFVTRIVPGAEKTDAVDDLRAKARHIRRDPNLAGDRRPLGRDHRVFILGKQHRQRCADRNHHIGAKARQPLGTAHAFAVEPDQPTAEHRHHQPQRHAQKRHFAQKIQRLEHPAQPPLFR